MIKQKMFRSVSNKTGVLIFGAVAVIFVALPIFAFSSRHDDLYVNAKANGTENGSKEHPYKTISQAIHKSKGKTEIHVANGEYKENITIKEDVKILGEDKKKTIINAKKGKWATITMKNDSEVNNFTIKKGEVGILVESHDSVKIVNCIVKNNDQDGIFIEGSNTKKSYQVIISKTEVKENNWSGIFSDGPRRIVITESDILNNKKNGVFLARGASAWIAENSINENKGSGLKLIIDGSDIWTKNNSIRRNGQEGMETSFFGGSGKINISKSKFVGNGFYGIAKIQKAVFGNNINLWNQYLIIDDKNEFWDNIKGNISNIL